ncbi:MAG: TauD/TfdA family dioxygenase [Proteobacteria bacterium]|nr:TauD/TfdA family dioxygenase [Pseudomonadota bacterium]
MTLQTQPLSDVMGAEALGIDLKGTLDDATIEALNDALHKHTVLCIRDQSFKGEGAEFAEATERVFGPLAPQENMEKIDGKPPVVATISSEDYDTRGSGKRIVRAVTWHTDHSFEECPPRATVLYATEVPTKGGATSFCNMRKAYRELADETKNRIAGLTGLHKYRSDRNPNKAPSIRLSDEEEVRSKFSGVPQPLVRTYIPTGEKALYLSTTRLESIIGMARTESDALLDSLMAHADQPQFHYHHQWRVGDMVIWDNRCSMHRANADYPDEDRRFLYRTMVKGEIPV